LSKLTRDAPIQAAAGRWTDGQLTKRQREPGENKSLAGGRRLFSKKPFFKAKGCVKVIPSNCNEVINNRSKAWLRLFVLTKKFTEKNAEE